MINGLQCKYLFSYFSIWILVTMWPTYILEEYCSLKKSFSMWLTFWQAFRLAKQLTSQNEILSSNHVSVHKSGLFEEALFSYFLSLFLISLVLRQSVKKYSLNRNNTAFFTILFYLFWNIKVQLKKFDLGPKHHWVNSFPNGK